MSIELYINYYVSKKKNYPIYITYNPFASDVYSLGVIMLKLMGLENKSIFEFKEKQVSL